jgi:hypothetical protein
VEACARYLTSGKEYLRYDQALASGWPIATGVIEGACRHLIGDRLEDRAQRGGGVVDGVRPGGKLVHQELVEDRAPVELKGRVAQHPAEVGSSPPCLWRTAGWPGL